MSNLFITAAIGSPDLIEASERLVRDVKSLKIFNRYVVITEPELHSLMPDVIQKIPPGHRNIQNKYGYYIWKPELARLAMAGQWGDFDSILFLDAGCEVLPSFWSRKYMLALLEKVKSNGAVVFHSNCPELNYTKRSVFSFFPSISPRDASPQIQSGSWMLSGELGKNIADKWASAATFSYEDISNDYIEFNEVEGFIAPRHDQSFFSLTCKSFGIQPEDSMPPGGGHGLRTQLRAIFFPFRWARNRTGENSNFFIFRLFGLLSLQTYFSLRFLLKM
jgi:hypothetical protein